MWIALILSIDLPILQRFTTSAFFSGGSYVFPALRWPRKVWPVLAAAVGVFDAPYGVLCVMYQFSAEHVYHDAHTCLLVGE